MQQVDVQHVALDPLTAVEQVTQVAQWCVEGDAAGLLDGLARTHLVGNRADATDARRDVGRLGVGATAQERLEEARRLEDAQAHVADRSVVDLDDQSTLAFGACEGLHLEAARAVIVAHGRSAPRASPSAAGGAWPAL